MVWSFPFEIILYTTTRSDTEENWDTDELSYLAKIKQPVSEGARIQVRSLGPDFCSWLLYIFPFLHFFHDRLTSQERIAEKSSSSDLSLSPVGFYSVCTLHSFVLLPNESLSY